MGYLLNSVIKSRDCRLLGRRWMSYGTRLGIAALLLAVSSGCADTAGALSGSDETARRDASEALEAVEELRSELATDLADLAALREELDAQRRSGAQAEARLDRRLDRLADRLERSLARIARRVEAAEGVSERVESALAEARSVARDLAVLDERLDYHLKNHGG
jgi:chromosome segregation ATPase